MISTLPMMIIIFGIFITSGSALKCYSCSSKSESSCDDPASNSQHFEVHLTQDCPQTGYSSGYNTRSRPICRKIVKRENGERIVVRQCSNPYPDEEDIYNGQCGQTIMRSAGGGSYPYDSQIESCHICNSNLCNSATNVSTKQWLFASALMFFVYTFYQSKYVYA